MASPPTSADAPSLPTSFRDGTGLVVADLLGHARLNSGRAYVRPTQGDRAKALNLLPPDR